jgi:outer membrane receptor protein involved in Fe transport
VSLSLFADYKFALGQLPGQFTLHGDANYRSKVYYNAFDGDPNQTQAAAWMANAQLRWDAPDKRWYLVGFVQNLTNELYKPYVAGGNCLRAGTPPYACVNVGQPQGAALFVRYVPPRTYGARIGFKF